MADAVNFHRTKYGPELLLDAAWLSEMAAFDRSERPYSLTFFDILLVTKGRGRFALDDEVHAVAPGVVFFTRPGEVRRWQAEGLEGACLFFTGDFLRDAFADARFIEQFAYWRPGRPSGALALSAHEQAQFLARFGEMRAEFDALKGDAAHLLRARLYEILVLLNRWYLARYGEAPARRPDARVERFLALVERDLSAERCVADYARELALTPGHLNALCRQGLGRPAGRLIRERLVLEAKRRLLASDGPAAAIAYGLGFADPAYFSRFFRRETGEAPRAFREARR